MFKLAFFNTADATQGLIKPRKALTTAPCLIEKAAKQASENLRHYLDDPKISIRPMKNREWDDLAEQWPRKHRWPSMVAHAKENRGGYALALYHGNRLCGLSLNSFMLNARSAKSGHELINIETADTMVEYMESGVTSTPLAGYVFSCLAETAQCIALAQGADRLVLSHVENASLDRYAAIMGFKEDPHAEDLDVTLDTGRGERLDWAAFTNYKQGRQKCSPQPLSI